ncbi:pilus assembly protein [Pseudomonas sp. Gutcm_11s]|uniref:pilus assembly protein n=1 Tax=Pseudomonas sp. Gutcm_11s TaxID=3026088 RepID=UPI0023621C98|nr:PilC/PilY family type IV pilus protein [Pseudomonas sp. Gutcm_11s]MDD0844520.1 PilC/PilY family type IV pilus protein [Pseudomonas sp. Gutcm_11s]
MKEYSLNNSAKISALGFFLYFAATFHASAAALNISQKPLILSETVAPNLLLTIDDSGSMRWAFVPDNVNGTSTSRRAKSAAFNPMYYNPDVTYRIPTRYDSAGAISATPYTTDFTNAYNNGFNNTRGSYDLSSSYRVTWTYNPKGSLDTTTSYTYNNTTNAFAANAAADFNFSSGSFAGPTTNGSSLAKTVSGVSFTVTRTSGGCTVSVSSAPTALSGVTASCSRSSSNYTVTIDARQVGRPAYYYVRDTSLSNCTATDKTDEDCYKLVFVSSTSGKSRADDSASGTDERKNFAIWYSFYRNRALATQSAAQIAFATLPPEIRLTWQNLANCTNLDGSDTTNCKDNKFREYTTAHRGRLMSWLQDPPFDGSTPLRSAMYRAGEFFKTATPWQKYPNDSTQTNTTANTYACRPSYHILMTDGIWNQAFTYPSGALQDNSSTTLPDSTKYDGKTTPFADSQTATLADLAFNYWATDLRSGLDNKLQPYYPFKSNDTAKNYWDPRNDPANWQHMVNFTMGLGLSSALSQSGLEWDAEKGTFGGTGYDNLVSGAKSWPAASADSANNVYDLWHAAINSRGEFFSVDSPDAMVQAFKDILNRIADRTTSAARPAVSASFVSDSDASIESNVYATQFSSNDWSGEIIKTWIDGGGAQTVKWKAQTANQSINHSTRTVMMKDLTNTTSKLKSFTWSNLGTLQPLMSVNPDSLVGATDSLGEARVAYIRGDRSKEGSASPAFRTRSTVLGDIINSSPVIVSTPTYLSYWADGIENPTGTNSGYKTYAAFKAANKKSLRKEMVYVGGNDGMLHGFNAATGVEEFAFIPTEVIKNLYRLTGQNYTGAEHRYFVDGTPLVRDVYFGNAANEGWRTVLIGTLRAGGKSLFALDITDPNNIKLLWEFDSTNDSDLGYTFAQPEVTRLHSGQWAVLMGNGYNSTNDKAAMLIIDLKTGSLLKKLTIPDIVENGVTLPNGLSSVRGADNNGDGLVDYAYAGDLQGNMWRFDLVPTTTATLTGDPFARSTFTTTLTDFKIGYGGNPIFTARDSQTGVGKRQAITIQPSLVRHPLVRGYLVLFGTGKYIESSDANVDTSRAMTIYGVWDRNTKRQATSTSTARATDRSKTQSQSFTAQVDNALIGEDGQTDINDIRLLSQNTIKWQKDYDAANPSSPANDSNNDASVNLWGWSLNLSVNNLLSGEMIINNMSASGQTLFFSSLTPNQDPCAAGADTWLYAIDAYTGGRTRYNVFDLNNDKTVSKLDAYGANKDIVSGRRFPAIGGFTLAPGNQAYGSDGANDPAVVGDDPNSNGRQSWHIIPEEFQ